LRIKLGTKTTTVGSYPSSAKRGVNGGSDVRRNRKVSVAISMPLTMIEEIDRLRGDTPRSIFVCKILYATVNVRRGIPGVATEHGIY
jgi:hypothetical protein